MPYGYPYQNPTPSYFNTNYAPTPTPNFQAQQQPSPTSNVSWIYVNGISGAKEHIVQPCQTAWMMDNNSPAIYIKAAGTQVTILGAKVTDTGCAIDANTGGYTVQASGVYRFSFDVTSTPSTAGDQILQLYKDGVALPAAIVTDETVADGVLTQHVESVMVIRTCAAVTPTITARISGVAGTINHTRASAVKLA